MRHIDTRHWIIGDEVYLRANVQAFQRSSEP